MKLTAYLLTQQDERIIKSFALPYSTKRVQEHLHNLAKNYFGHKEGRDYRIVQDSTVIGFHAKNMNGDCIEFR